MLPRSRSGCRCGLRRGERPIGLVFPGKAAGVVPWRTGNSTIVAGAEPPGAALAGGILDGRRGCGTAARWGDRTLRSSTVSAVSRARGGATCSHPEVILRKHS